MKQLLQNVGTPIFAVERVWEQLIRIFHFEDAKHEAIDVLHVEQRFNLSAI